MTVAGMEPICAEIFPGNSIDASSYPAFIRDNDIRKGIIVADKGFPPSKIKDELSERPDLHFLTPIKRNDVRMDDLSSAWRRTDAPNDPSTDDGYWVHTLKTVFEELEALGLSKPVPKPEPKKRGRKPKSKDQTALE